MQDDESRPKAAAGALTKSQIASMLVAAAMIACLFAWTFHQDSSGLPPRNAHAPPGALRMVALVCVISAWITATGILQRRQLRKTPAATRAGRSKLRRPPRNFGRSVLLWQLGMASVLFLYPTRSHWTYESVGLDAEWPVAVSCAVGVACYLAFYVGVNLIVNVVGNASTLADHYLQIHARIWPRARSEKHLARLAICILNPVFEELMFRGIVVHQFADAIGSRSVPILLGLIVTLGNHSYQGLRGWWTHAPFYFLVVALLFSPAGLWGAIGFHFAGDVVPFGTLRLAMNDYRKRHRHGAATAPIRSA